VCHTRALLQRGSLIENSYIKCLDFYLYILCQYLGLHVICLLETYVRNFVEYVDGPGHPTQNEADNDVDHRFRDVDFCLRQTILSALTFFPGHINIMDAAGYI